MKKLQLLFVLILLPMVASADAVVIDGIYYSLVSKTKNATVVSNPNQYSGDIVIPEKVTYEGEEYTVTTIGRGSFENCITLTSVSIPNSVTVIKSEAFYGCYKLTSVTLPESISLIPSMTFGYCTNLFSIDIPEGVTQIEDNAFVHCNRLTSVTIPNSMTVIRDYAFMECEKLQAVHIKDLAAWCEISFTSETSNPLYYAHHLYINEEEVKDLIIPSSLTEIKEKTFFYCTGITSVTIPEGVTTINYRAFAFCKGLTTIVTPNSLSTINKEAFCACTGLTTITTPSNVINLERGVFSGCSGLTTVIIPEKVTTIGYETFSGCKELMDVYCYSEQVPTTNAYAFQNSYIEYATLHVPQSSISLYQAAEPWKNFKAIVSIEGGGNPDPEQPEIPQCSIPTISYNNGEIVFGCETEGVNYNYNIIDNDIKSGTGAKVTLTATYTISVYATKTGYENSETATATLCWIDVEPKKEGITDGITNVPARAVMIQSNGGILTIEGADDGTPVSVYGINGTQEGTATVSNGSAIINTTLQPGSIALVKIGQKSVKVVMK